MRNKITHLYSFSMFNVVLAHVDYFQDILRYRNQAGIFFFLDDKTIQRRKFVSESDFPMQIS